MERRKSRRMPIKMELNIESLYKQDEEYDAHNVAIEFTDISKTGIGFQSHSDLPLGFYFNGQIMIDDEKKFYGVMKIVRKAEDGQTYHYGCEFVGLADILSGCLDDYERELEEKEQ